MMAVTLISDRPIVNVSVDITPEAVSNQSVGTFICMSFWTANFTSIPTIKWKVDGTRYDGSRCELNTTLCNITVSTNNLNQTNKLDTIISTTEQSVTVMCAVHYISDDTEIRLPFVDQQVQFGKDYCSV